MYVVFKFYKIYAPQLFVFFWVLRGEIPTSHSSILGLTDDVPTAQTIQKTQLQSTRTAANTTLPYIAAFSANLNGFTPACSRYTVDIGNVWAVVCHGYDLP